MKAKKIFFKFITSLTFLLQLMVVIQTSETAEATTFSAASYSAFSNSGITLSQITSGEFNGYYEIDSIETLYLLQFMRTGTGNGTSIPLINRKFVITKDLDFNNDSDYESFNSGFLFGNFNLDNTTRGTIKEQLTTGAGWKPLLLPVYHLVGSGLVEISNLYINTPNGRSSFISAIQDSPYADGRISNINFIDAKIYQNSNNQFTAGLIAFYGRLTGGDVPKLTIDNVHFTNAYIGTQSKNSNDNYMGGFIASYTQDAILNISNSSFDGTLNNNSSSSTSSTLWVGGLIGHINSTGTSQNTTINNSFSLVNIYSNRRSLAGGFVGNVSGSSTTGLLTIKDSYTVVYGEDLSGNSSSAFGGLIATTTNLSSDSTMKVNISNVAVYGTSSGFKGTQTGLGRLRNTSGSFIKDTFANVDQYNGGDLVKFAYGFNSMDALSNFTFSNNFVFDLSIQENGGFPTSRGNTSSVPKEFISSGAWLDTVLNNNSSSWQIDPTTNVTDIVKLYESGTSVLLPNQRNVRLSDYLVNSNFTLTFNSNGGTSISPVNELMYTPVLIADPVRTGYVFGGWSTTAGLNTGIYFPNYMPAQNLTLNAIWLVDVVYESVGTTFATQTIAAGTKTSPPSPPPTRAGYTFGGWFTDNGTFNNQFDFNTTIDPGITLYALWVPENSYTITYNLNGGVNNTGNPSIYNIDSPSTIILLEPTRQGFAFAGWYENADLETSPISQFSNTRNENLTLYAKWILTSFTITFDSSPGSTVNPVSGNEGDVVGLPTPTLQDHRFDGWVNSAGQLVRIHTR
jgi:uncharacterized repeat protein (TIGR02543 family)